jgi:hypothetical protein
VALPDLVTSVRSMKELAAQFFGGKRQGVPAGAPARIGGAGDPPTPTMPAGTEPRALVLPFGYNIAARPRTGTGRTLTPFEQLRALADFDLVRIVIEDIKSQVIGMRGEVRLRSEFKGQEKRLQGRIDEVRAFIECPDPLAEIEWPQWVAPVVEEILVTDALSILPRKDLGDRLIGMEVLDGATIVPLADDRGRPPLPPAVAYEQIVNGMVETEFMLGQIIYAPRNRRGNNLYGRSNVENVLFTANLAIRQALGEISFYTEGNVPDGGFWKVPETWTPEQLEKAQKLLDDISSTPGKRSGYVKLMPPGDYVATKDRAWEYEAYEWLSRVIAWGFGVSPLPIAKQQNRSTGETLEQSAIESGVRPVADYVATVVNRVLRTYGGVTEVEFAWADDEVEDPRVVFERQAVLLGRGALTINQAREQQGLEPYDFETPPMMDTPSGPQLVEKLIEDLKNPPDPPPALDPNAPPVPPTDEPPPADVEVEVDEEEETAQEKAWRAAFAKYRAAVVVDLRKWKDVVSKRAKAGKAQKTFRSSVIPPSLRKKIDLEDRPALTTWTLADEIALFKGELKVTGKRRKIERAIESLIKGWLDGLEPQVLAWALEQLPAAKVRKADPDFDAGDLADDLAAQLEAGASLGAAEAAQAIGVNLEKVPESVITYARRRAGELIGKQYVAGQWVDSTSGSAISDKLRRDVKDAISRAIEESWTPQELSSTLKSYFEVSRAATIARTETGFAYGNGAAELYKSEGIDDLKVNDGPGCLPFGHDDQAAKASGDVGVVDATAEADGQIWTVAQYQGAILGHPNCVRVAVPYFRDDVAAAA